MTRESSRMGQNKLESHSTLIKTHHRMQSDGWDSSRDEKLRPHYTFCSEFKQLFSYLKCHTRPRSIMKCEMSHNEMWKMKDGDFSAVLLQRVALLARRVWEISLHLSRLFPSIDVFCSRMCTFRERVFNYSSKPWRTFPDELIPSTPRPGPVGGIHNFHLCDSDCGRQQRQMFWKEIMFVIFISTEKLSRLFRTIANRTTNARRPSPLLFFHVHQLCKSTKKDCNFPSFPRRAGILYDNRMWCMSWFEVWSTFRNYFPFSTRLQSQSFGCLFPSTNIEHTNEVPTNFFCCHFEEFSPKSKKFFCCSWKLLNSWCGVVIIGFVTEMNSSAAKN